jgi:ABC-type cobalamin/Fe3+-siderophores transport system ATPase subunit
MPEQMGMPTEMPEAPEAEGGEQERENKTRELLQAIMATQDINEAHSLCEQIIALEQEEAAQEGEEQAPEQGLRENLMAAANKGEEAV